MSQTKTCGFSFSEASQCSFQSLLLQNQQNISGSPKPKVGMLRVHCQSCLPSLGKPLRAPQARSALTAVGQLASLASSGVCSHSCSLIFETGFGAEYFADVPWKTSLTSLHTELNKTLPCCPWKSTWTCKCVRMSPARGLYRKYVGGQQMRVRKSSGTGNNHLIRRFSDPKNHIQS